MQLININPFYFLYLLIHYCNINKVFEYLTSKHGINDFVVNFLIKKIYLLNRKESVKSVLNNRTTELTYVQDNLNRYLGHTKSINCLNSTDKEWRILHSTLKNTINCPNGSITDYFTSNMWILSENHPSLNDKCEHYINAVFAQFNYGKNVNMELYLETRQLIICYLKRFHQSNIIRIPYLGALYCKLMRLYYSKEMHKIVSNLVRLYSLSNSDSAIYKFGAELKKNGFDDINMIIDNSLLAFLENDFIYLVMMDYLVSNHDDIYSSVNNGFLYPVRYRITNCQTEDIPANSLVIYNLLNADLPFSYGSRACVGQGMVTSSIFPIIKQIKSWIVKLDTSKNYYLTTRSDNIPMMTNITNYDIELPKNYLQDIIPCISNNKKVKIYKLLSIYQNPFLTNYCVNKIICRIKTYNNIDGIVSPEARAWPLVGAVGIKSHLSLIGIRKKGAIPGPVHTIEYNKGYTDQKDILEIEQQDLTGKKFVLIDDGIASGGSAKACIELVNKCGGVVVELIVIVKHTYCQCIDLGIPVTHLFVIDKY